MCVPVPSPLSPALSATPRLLISFPSIPFDITAGTMIASGRGAATVEGGASTSRMVGRGEVLTSAASAAAAHGGSRGLGGVIAALVILPVAIQVPPRQSARLRPASPSPIVTPHPPMTHVLTDPPAMSYPLPFPPLATRPSALTVFVPVPLSLIFLKRAIYFVGQGGVACPVCIGRPRRRSQEVKRGVGAAGLRVVGRFTYALLPPSPCAKQAHCSTPSRAAANRDYARTSVRKTTGNPAGIAHASMGELLRRPQTWAPMAKALPSHGAGGPNPIAGARKSSVGGAGTRRRHATYPQ